jgi:hypothetical protein
MSGDGDPGGHGSIYNEGGLVSKPKPKRKKSKSNFKRGGLASRK